jgi:hypothetical protein
LGTLELDRAERAFDTDPDAVAAIAATAQATLRDARDRFPAYPHRDLILYQLGYASELAGDGPGARDAYQALAATSGSALASEGWFRLGEQAFLDGDLPAAVAAYQHVANVAPYATIVAYKVAWGHWRAGDMAAAVQAFDAFLARPEGPQPAGPTRSYRVAVPSRPYRVAATRRRSRTESLRPGVGGVGRPGLGPTRSYRVAATRRRRRTGVPSRRPAFRVAATRRTGSDPVVPSRCDPA